ncbi:hypothetical protein ACFWNL_18210 [Kitasatospora sp. NPDC058397]|uniref:hypothetical protein n=1 Tax=unclassified Kitasatospora TaxID=2633591 RepID=UPI00365C84D5
MDTEPTDLRDAFAANVARLAKRNRNAGHAQGTTATGHTVSFTGLRGDRVATIAITAPDGVEITSAEGWKLTDVADAAANFWDWMEDDRQRAARQARRAAFRTVTITSGRDAAQYRLTPDQLARLRETAEQMAAENPGE